MEVWKKHPLLPYEVSTEGRVRRNNKILKPQNHTDSYLFIQISCDGIKSNKKIHRLVAETFLENTDNLPTVDHINRNHKDNRLSNLRWCSYSDQMVNRDYNNTLGLRHIRKNQSNKFQVRIQRNYIVFIDKTFDTLDEAILFRNSILSYVAAG